MFFSQNGHLLVIACRDVEKRNEINGMFLQLKRVDLFTQESKTSQKTIQFQFAKKHHLAGEPAALVSFLEKHIL